MRRFPLFCTLMPLLAAVPCVASAQAMVENALGAGRAAVSTAPMQGLSKSIGGVMGNLEKTLNKSLSSPEFQPAAPVRMAQLAVVAAPAPVVHYDDPKLIETGTVYGELVQRFGPAAVEITTGPAAKTLSYVSREGAYQVEVSDGKVTSIVAVTRH